jgi:chromate transport protein ChrA
MKRFFTILGMALWEITKKLAFTALVIGVIAGFCTLAFVYPSPFFITLGVITGLLVLLRFMSKVAERLEEKERAAQRARDRELNDRFRRPE